jgi:diketogulonate reductase-like aldo/keto reductase
MEQAVDDGLVRSLGCSNMTARKLQALVQVTIKCTGLRVFR